ncbi:hypothetical protein DPMN_128856 [Dreissena polymorpha]|uniref:Uncharacterized protein n=1 Tax=Dreissena polymorpha TaxID=45954 RepID=A0A9D4H080_DREPO|nr:hypothetical protein DPMN_128856 [Dreissena polymorpha]
MLAVNTLPECRGSNCTFVSYDSTCRTTIDYICLPVETADLVLFSEIIDDDCLNVSRHRPVLLCFNVYWFSSLSVPEVCQQKTYINWKRVTREDAEHYQSLLSSSRVIQRLCSDTLDRQEIDRAYIDLTNTLYSYANESLPQKRFKSFLKPFWCLALTEAHINSRLARDQWCRAGRPRDRKCFEYTSYKAAKRIFGRLHWVCANRFMADMDK